MQVSRDERGPHLVLPFERADEVRARLLELGIDFEEDAETGAGCAGPVWVVLRLDERTLRGYGGGAKLEADLREDAPLQDGTRQDS